MAVKRIFVTGASGSVGHYVVDTLVRETSHELYLLVRDPNRLQIETQSRPGVTLVRGDMRDIAQLAPLLRTMDAAVLIAASWGGPDVRRINVEMTLKLLDLLDPAVCEQVLYFSTASVLNRQNQPLPEAGKLGGDYVRTKYECLTRIPESRLAPRITVLFPTVVLGEGAREANIRLSTLLPQVVRRVGYMRFLRADASFHFIHARDIAQVVRYLVDHPETEVGPRLRVLGQERMTFDQVIEDLCAYLGKRMYWRLSLTGPLVSALVALLRVQMDPWDRFCLTYRHFSYQDPVNPERYGLKSYCATIADILRIGGIAPAPGWIPRERRLSAAQEGESKLQ
jgi:nucleoside-diphosphate-sugar epimerase